MGGSGFIGTHTVLALARAGHEVRSFSRSGTHLLPVPEALRSRVEVVQGDFAKVADVQRALEACDTCVHLVSDSVPHSSNLDPIGDIARNLVPSVQLAQASVAQGLRRIVFVSSGGTVYGRPRRVPIDETHPTDPLCGYGITKLAAEKYFGLFAALHGLDSIVLRLANPFGEGQRIAASQGAVAVFMAKAIRGQPIEIWGDGSVVRDYLYVSDAVDAILRALEYQGSERLFNIGAGRGHSLNQVLDGIERTLGLKTARRYLPGRPFDVPVSVLDIGLAARELPWSPATSFEAALQRTADWMRAVLRDKA